MDSIVSGDDMFRIFHANQPPYDLYKVIFREVQRFSAIMQQAVQIKGGHWLRFQFLQSTNGNDQNGYLGRLYLVRSNLDTHIVTFDDFVLFHSG